MTQVSLFHAILGNFDTGSLRVCNFSSHPFMKSAPPSDLQLLRGYSQLTNYTKAYHSKTTCQTVLISFPIMLIPPGYLFHSHQAGCLPSTQCSTSSRLRRVILIRLEFSISSFLCSGPMYSGAGLRKNMRVSPVATWLSQMPGLPKPPIITLLPPSRRISRLTLDFPFK